MTLPLLLLHEGPSAAHDEPGHPETEARLRAVRRRLRTDADLQALPAREATTDAGDDLLQAVHRSEHLLDVERAVRSGGGWIDPDTYCTSASLDVARRAAGAVVEAVDAVMEGEARSAFAVVRPPGHHATSRRAMGFCLLNSVAVGVRAAQRRHGAGRVAVIDIDVHHGNGTQEIFYADPDVLVCSLHQFPLYPFSGRHGETGEGRGAGATLNIPLAPGTGGEAWLELFDEHVLPRVRAHAPDLIVVSAGFDAHEADPLAQLRLATPTYGAIAGRISALAGEVCGGRSVWALEGGYDLEALPASVAAVVRTLGAVA